MRVTDVDLVNGYVPGLLGRVAALHGEYYGAHWGFGAFFECRVARDLAEFLERYDGARDGIWSAPAGEEVAASIAIDGRHAATDGAHLRWFIVAPSLHGHGLGTRLLDAAIQFSRERGYAQIYLHTFEGLDPARRLYEKNGFRLVEQRRGTQWGTAVDEQKFLLHLD